MCKENNLDIFSEKDFYEKIICVNSGWHTRTVRDMFKKKTVGIKNANDILSRENLNGIPEWILAGVLRALDSYGYRRKDCSIEMYPTIDEYFREHFCCLWCGKQLDKNSNTKKLFCADCDQRSERLCQNKVLEVFLNIVDDREEYEIDKIELDVEVIIRNNSEIPLNIKLNSFILCHNKMQVLSDLDYGDYLDEDCLKPNEEITLKRSWYDIENLYNDDHFIISISDLTHNKECIYKFAKRYQNDDYWETDLINRIVRQDELKKNALKNMTLIGLPETCIEAFQKSETVCLIDGKSSKPINKDNMPELFKKIKSVELASNSIVYAVFNEPNLYINGNTDVFLMLCAYTSSIELGKIYKSGQICKLIAYAWNKKTDILEHTYTCLQTSKNGVWCLPYRITKIIAPEIE